MCTFNKDKKRPHVGSQRLARLYVVGIQRLPAFKYSAVARLLVVGIQRLPAHFFFFF